MAFPDTSSLLDAFLSAIFIRMRLFCLQLDPGSFLEDQIVTPHPPTPEVLSKDFLSATRSRMEILAKENMSLSGQKLLPLQFPELSLP